MKWKLINESTGVEVSFPTTIQREKDKMTVIGGQIPRHSGSTGKIYASDNSIHGYSAYCPNVAGLKWIDEDEVKCFVIEESYKNNGQEFTDHAIVKAHTEKDACKAWHDHYSMYPGTFDEIDAGDYTIKFVEIKEIDKSEFDILHKYFLEIETETQKEI